MPDNELHLLKALQEWEEKKQSKQNAILRNFYTVLTIIMLGGSGFLTYINVTHPTMKEFGDYKEAQTIAIGQSIAQALKPVANDVANVYAQISTLSNNIVQLQMKVQEVSLTLNSNRFVDSLKYNEQISVMKENIQELKIRVASLEGKIDNIAQLKGAIAQLEQNLAIIEKVNNTK